MKIIVDVPDNDYNDIKNGVCCYGYEADMIIYNGIPYRNVEKKLKRRDNKIIELEKKLRRRDNKIIELEDKLKHEHDWDDYKDGDFSGGR